MKPYPSGGGTCKPPETLFTPMNINTDDKAVIEKPTVTRTAQKFASTIHTSKINLEYLLTTVPGELIFEKTNNTVEKKSTHENIKDYHNCKPTPEWPNLSKL